jgi:hypothetical protein
VPTSSCNPPGATPPEAGTTYTRVYEMTTESNPKSPSLSAGGERGYNASASNLHCEDMTIDEKQGLLASWASDARAVPNHPALRRLDDGRGVEIDDILDELKRVDGSLSSRGSTREGEWYRPRCQVSPSRRASRDLNGPDDDPTTPAPAAPRPRPPVLTDSQALAAA